MIVSLLTLALVFILIAVRQVGRVNIRIWQAMLLGALVVVVTGQIALKVALRAINLDVIALLVSMFVVGRALEDSGTLEDLCFRFFSRAGTMDGLLLLILFGSAAGSILLMNDTIAIIGTPVVLLLARKNGVSPKPLLLALAFGITIGSVTSPIGNPQNLLVAMGGVKNTFVTFSRWLMLPTILNLFATYFLLRFSFKNTFGPSVPQHSPVNITDAKLARISRLSLIILLSLIAVKVVIVLSGVRFELPLTVIAAVPAVFILIVSRRRWAIVHRIDWSTIAFFAAMFILMESVWRTGFFQSLIADWHLDLRKPGIILGVSVGLSQFISNVPLVALLKPMLLHVGAGTRDFMALVAGSTVAGNLTILGAASNVIIIQNAESREGHTLTFLEFARLGAPLTLINVFVYWLYLIVV